MARFFSMTLETQAAFARRIGRDKSYVTRLKQSGRLVMREGKVDVEESERLVGDTQSQLPRDAANRERLAVERLVDEPAPGGDLAEAGRRLKRAQADKAEHEAEMLKLERARLEGSLVELADVKNTATDIAAVMRAALENLADRYAPELTAATEVNQAHAILAEALELVLGELARKIDKLAQELAL
jgi:hypothetical protein